MSDNFQQTVNLRDKMKPKAQSAVRTQPSGPRMEERVPPPQPRHLADEIDHVYGGDDGTGTEDRDLKKISRPKISPAGDLVKWIISIAILAAVCGAGYFIFFRGKNDAPAAAVNIESRWYAIKLTTGEVYYGLIGDVAADPIVIANVYYNYDQNIDSKDTNEAGNLRLIKRGKETYGPNGSIYIVRAQAVYMEPLADDSKVLKAILDYEK